MPELPDITVYREAIAERVLGTRYEKARLASPFLLRSVDPSLSDLEGRHVEGVLRLGKRVVLALQGDLFLVLHLMIAGRLHWAERGAKIRGKIGLAAFDFEKGTLLLTEASSKKRASLLAVRGRAALDALRRAGVEPLECDETAFAAALRRENHTIKRSLTDPDVVSGVGNAYSDEILHRARMAPTLLTQKMTDAQIATLFAATREVLEEWIERLRADAAGAFPEKVTAFRPEMAVHGRFKQPCPDCGEPVQRIVHGDHETNYCARCQTGGRLLADRALSKLFRGDWPKTLDDA